MDQKSQSNHFSTRTEDYDRLQPIRLEMYNFYHRLALDFIPFDTQDAFRMLDLGCGTATFRILTTLFSVWDKSNSNFADSKG